MPTIALDAMGGDHAPDAVVRGAALVSTTTDIETLLVGDERRLQAILDQVPYNPEHLAIVPAVKHLSHLPILVDPSHGTGQRDKVAPLARAAVAVGADGVMIEVHHDPAKALSDGPQALLPEQFRQLVKDLRALGSLVGQSRHDSASPVTIP